MAFLFRLPSMGIGFSFNIIGLMHPDQAFITTVLTAQLRMII